MSFPKKLSVRLCPFGYCYNFYHKQAVLKILKVLACLSCQDQRAGVRVCVGEWLHLGLAPFPEAALCDLQPSPPPPGPESETTAGFTC